MKNRLSKENLDWAFANLKKLEHLTSLSLVMERELKEIMATENYVEKAISLACKDQRAFAFALGELIVECDDVTLHKIGGVIYRLYDDKETSYRLLFVIGKAFPSVTPARRIFLQNLCFKVDFTQNFCFRDWIVAYNELYFADFLLGGNNFLRELLQKCEDGIGRCIDYYDWVLSDVKRHILALNKVNNEYAFGLNKICRIAAQRHYGYSRFEHAHIVWELSKNQKDQKLAEELAKDAIDLSVWTDRCSKFIREICSSKFDQEWQIKAFAANVKAHPELLNSLYDFVERATNTNDDAEYLRDMYEEIYNDTTAQKVMDTLICSLKNADFDVVRGPLVKPLVYLAVKYVRSNPSLGLVKDLFEYVLKLEWNEDEMPFLEEYFREESKHLGVSSLSECLKYAGSEQNNKLLGYFEGPTVEDIQKREEQIEKDAEFERKKQELMDILKD